MPALVTRTALGIGATALAIATALVTGACRDQREECRTAPVEGLAVAVGSRANSPAPIPPPVLGQHLERIMNERKGVTVVRVDGRPTVACAFRFNPVANNHAAKLAERRDFTGNVVQAIANVKAKEPEADPLRALTHAATAAGPGGTVVLIDSGLQTVPPLDFREPGLLDADPEAVVAELSRRSLLPKLEQRTVVLAGIGYAASPQALLDPARVAHLVALWQAIVRAGGASTVDVVPTPNTGKAARDDPKVSPVPVPPLDNIHLGCNTRSVLANSGSVGFVADSTRFIDEAAARRTLAQFADWLVANPHARMELVGTVAHYGRDEGNAGLSRARAERVRAVLVDLGADGRRIRAVGDGWGPEPSKKAPPGAAYDQLNRRVVVEVKC